MSKKNKLPKIKKEVKRFLKNEEGKMTKEEVVNLGTTIAAISFFVSGNMSESHTSYVKKQDSPTHGEGEEGAMFASLKDPDFLAHDSTYDYSEDCHDSHSSCHSQHSSCHAQHSSCHSSCHDSHSSCHNQHDSCHVSHDQTHDSCDGAEPHESHNSHNQHSSCSHGQHASCHAQHSNHYSCHSNHSSCHSSHDSCHSNHSSCHSSCHSSHDSCHSSCHDSHASHSNCSHSSCGCPFIVLWDGEKFVLENNILPESENQERDSLIVQDLYKLENNPSPEDGFYKIRIAEFEQERSYFKDFELIKVSHPENVHVGVVNNEIVAYEDIISPDKILAGGNEADSDELIKKEKGENISLIFNKLDKKHNLLVMNTGLRGEGRRVKKAEEILSNDKSIDLFAAEATAALGLLTTPKPGYAAATPIDKCASLVYSIKNKEIADTHPREKLSTNLLDIKSYLENGDSLKIEVVWTDTHNMSPVGLAKRIDTEKLNIKKIQPETILHSQESKDKMQLEPGETLTINFPETKTNKQKETFLLKSKGYYEQI